MPLQKYVNIMKTANDITTVSLVAVMKYFCIIKHDLIYILEKFQILYNITALIWRMRKENDLTIEKRIVDLIPVSTLDKSCHLNI